MRVVVLLAVAVLAVSTSGPIMAGTTVPALATAFWRNGFATLALAPQALGSRRHELTRLDRPALLLVGSAGLALAVHFGTWVTSLRLTSVASATALVSLQTAWVVTWHLLRGHPMGRLAVPGLLLSLGGVLVVSGVDLSLSPRALLGDVLALLGGVASAVYIMLGSRARRTVSTTTYTFVCYGSCSVLLLVSCLVGRQPLVGYAWPQWGLLLLVTLTAQLMGHSVFNHLLAGTGPVVVALALLLEVPGAALLAAAFLHQQPPVATFVGLVVILAGLAMVIVSGRGVTEREAPID